MLKNPLKRSRQKGFSLVESMVGITLGLFVVTGALVLMSTMTKNNRDLMMETRLIQDLRTSSDLVARDIRRAGYWASAADGVYVPPSAGSPVAAASLPKNPYQNIIQDSCDAPTPASSNPSTAICYYIDANNYGFKLDATAGVLYAFVAGTPPQALSDPNTVKITQFNLIASPLQISLPGNCAAASVPNPPQVVVREFEIELRGHPPSDSTLVRAVRTKARVRNDAVSGSCS
ncbi:PilW family protein [Acidovorax soli]|uniref:Type IV pilin N-term methylation site GFxxxE n=1 Tax=Acidovorax soli TaxID=592050 RepID=A0A1H3WZK6_9BURK|nr:prepilin-type N-terminal cleavage/methylation domain-containing protein [Acidovorax soli]SDZ91864.1 Type IV pilin N-term methylation site GFxxxE [Acidovorax soli]